MVRSWVDRDHVGLGSCFYWGPGWLPRLTGAHSLSVNLKHKRREFKVWEEKWRVVQIVIEITKDPAWGKVAGSWSTCVAGSVCLFEIVLLEVDPWAIKAHCQGLHCKPVAVPLILHSNLAFSSWAEAADGQTLFGCNVCMCHLPVWISGKPVGRWCVSPARDFRLFTVGWSPWKY